MQEDRQTEQVSEVDSTSELPVYTNEQVLSAYCEVKYISLRQLFIWPITEREAEVICGLCSWHQELNLGY